MRIMRHLMTVTKLKDYLIIIVVISLIGLGGYEYYQWKRPVPIQQVQQINPDEIAKALIKMGYKPTEKEVTTIIREIEVAKSSPPEATKQTITSKEGSLWAQQQAKQTGGDKIIQEIPKPYTNNFYSIKLDKSHEIAVGVTYLGDKLYESVAYQDKLNQVINHGQGINVKGGSYLRTVARW